MSSNAYSVPCPQCGVEAGRNCQSSSGTVFHYVAHWQRKALAAESAA